MSKKKRMIRGHRRRIVARRRWVNGSRDGYLKKIHKNKNNTVSLITGLSPTHTHTDTSRTRVQDLSLVKLQGLVMVKVMINTRGLAKWGNITFLNLDFLDFIKIGRYCFIPSRFANCTKSGLSSYVSPEICRGSKLHISRQSECRV